MKPLKLRNAISPTSGRREPVVKDGKKAKESKIFDFKELGITALLAFVSLGLYLLVASLLGTGKNFYLVQILAFVVTGLVLLAFGLGQSKTSQYARPVLTFLILFLIFSMSHHYLSQDSSKTTKSIKEKKVVWTGVSTAAATTVATSDAYGPGTYSLNIARNHQRWIKVARGCTYNFNKEATLLVQTKDGKIFDSRQPGAWPNTDKLLVTNLGDIPISLIVTRNK